MLSIKGQLYTGVDEDGVPFLCVGDGTSPVADLVKFQPLSAQVDHGHPVDGGEVEI